MSAHNFLGKSGPVEIEPCDCDKDKSAAAIIIHRLHGERIALCVNCAAHIVYEIFQVIRAARVDVGHA